jgi:2-C-methyl-D-erythritol 2,4-cyclodiphosphate synthase
MALRIGLGIDSHRIGSGGPMRLGGIDVPGDYHLIGHSDADVLLHAITDALLGAAGMEDIGQLFPDTAAENKGRDSAELLAVVWSKVAALGFEIINVDCVVRMERPKIAPVKLAIRERIASILKIDVDQISLKGKTGEATGDIGQSRLVEAHCVALLQKTTTID